MRLAPLLLLLAAHPLAAQFRLPKPRVPNPLDRAATSGPRAPTYDDRVLEITQPRITAFLRGLQAERQARPGLEAGYKQNADDRAAAQVAIRRRGDQTAQVNGCMMAAAGMDTVAERKLSERVRAAEDRGDEATVARLRDSVMNAAMADGGRRALAMAQAYQPCLAQFNAASSAVPAPPPEPGLPLADSLHVLGAQAAGLTPDQYTLMQERVLGYLNSDEDQLRRGRGWAFSAGELDVLHAHKRELQPYQTMFADH
jgi:hypothetical protein